MCVCNSFYQFHIVFIHCFSDTVIVISFLMNNKQLVEMPQQTENPCHGHISFVLARGVLQARCGDKNFKAGA